MLIAPLMLTGRVWFISFDEDLDLEFDRFLQNLKGGKIESAIVVTENQVRPQQDIKDWADAVCLVGDSQSFCARLVWYFGQECAEFLLAK